MLYLLFKSRSLEHMDTSPGDVKLDDARGLNNGLGLTGFDVYIMESTSRQSKLELDRYLEESLLPRSHEFDVMRWWKLHKVKYPMLSKMAHDILTIPVSTVSPGWF